MADFKIKRADGRSSVQVLLDLVKGGEPGSVYTYDDLAAALGLGCTHTYTEREVQSVATRAYPRLLKEQARALHNVRNIGYRLAPAAYHVTLASDRQLKADRQLLRGVQTLQNVRWTELSPNERTAHEGQLLIVGALYQQMQALERRQANVEEAIKKAFGEPLA
jgi:hypothetical protein